MIRRSRALSMSTAFLMLVIPLLVAFSSVAYAQTADELAIREEAMGQESQGRLREALTAWNMLRASPTLGSEASRNVQRLTRMQADLQRRTQLAAVDQDAARTRAAAESWEEDKGLYSIGYHVNNETLPFANGLVAGGWGPQFRLSFRSRWVVGGATGGLTFGSNAQPDSERTIDLNLWNAGGFLGLQYTPTNPSMRWLTLYPLVELGGGGVSFDGGDLESVSDATAVERSLLGSDLTGFMLGGRLGARIHPFEDDSAPLGFSVEAGIRDYDGSTTNSISVGFDYGWN